MIVAAWKGHTDTLTVEAQEDGPYRLHGLGIDRTLAWAERDVTWHAGWIASTRFTPPLKRAV